jgi:hypothetical protein
MQRICVVPGGVKAYQADPRCVLVEENRRCVFCEEPHRLRVHGSYLRYALFPDPEPVHQIPVLRLLCPRAGRTVSLLPEFCLPRRQHGPAIVGIFLRELVLAGEGLLKALRRARAGVSGHAVAQALLGGFRKRVGELRAYLAGLRHRVVRGASAGPERFGDLVPVVAGLLEGFPDAPEAFLYHGRCFHESFGKGLA